MKFSEAWLRQWVNPSLDSANLLHQMTMAGLEVDGTEPAAKVFSGVVVAQIKSAEQHPDADKLKVCQVSDGVDVFQVVCGAPNAREGLITAFAKVGAVLPDNFKIKKAKLRGVESFGMLCGADEIGLEEDSEGIIELPADSTIGADLAGIAGADLPLDDLTVDVDLTPNRGDCLSLKGLAREVGVLNNLEVTYPEIPAVAPQIDTTFPVEVIAGEQCPRYLGRVIEGVDLSQPSPSWLTERLRRCGLRSIDPVVDVTNFVLIEQGQPMHAFDLARLQGGITVRMALIEDKLTLLSGQEVSLDENTLVIADGTGPVAMAGVMGGEHTGVSADSKDIFFECAFFSPLAIAGTARRYGLHTDASHRYERGVDSQLQHQALERATQILIDITGGRPGPITEALSAEHLPNIAPITLRESKVNSLLGIDIDPTQVDQALARLDFTVHSREQIESGLTWQVTAPSHRFDIALEADLVEEICRIYGYNNIPSTQPVIRLPLATVPLQTHSEPQLKRQLAGLGFQEVVTYSFIDPATQRLFDPDVEPLMLANPMSSEQSVMRTTLLTGLADAAKKNISRQQTSGQLFEVGLVFDTSAEDQGLMQKVKVAGALWGRRQDENWCETADKVDFFDVKGNVEALCAWAGISVDVATTQDVALHPGQSAQLTLNGEVVGRIGRLHPVIEKHLGLPEVFVFELDGQAMMARPSRRHHGVSKFPSVRRDLAVVVKRDVTASEVVATVSNVLNENCIDIMLFDVYQGEGIDSNEKSLGLGLTLQSQTTTLNEEEINALAEQATQALMDKYQARLR
ncbi:MAG: phenylalanine--tRNA ligase subunit beta [Pseudomonadales bacterium]|nr:phenylalanine--tRNA ligase subunit beta [Pseudomonadales bacterium]